MVQTQVTAKTQQEVADATARQALYEAMARVAQINPDSADAIAVALAVSSVREEDGDTQPIVQLQREENEALAVVKAVAPALITTLGTVGVAALQADVNKTQSNNAAAVAIADAATDADIMRSVTDMATSGLENSGVDVGGDYMIADNIDQSVTNTETNTQTMTETTTTTETNTVTETSDSYNQATYQTPEGNYYNADDLLALITAGIRVTVLVDGEEVEAELADCPDGSPGLTFGGGSVVCE